MSESSKTPRVLQRTEVSRLLCDYIEQWVAEVLPGPDILYGPDTGKNIGRHIRDRMMNEGYAIFKIEDS